MRIILEMGREWDFDALPEGSIALDGAVGGPRLDPAGRRYSFDHHADCIRLATSATCQQVLDAILLGLDPSGMDVLINDLDADTILSVWLLRHHQRWRETTCLASVRPLVFTIALGDAHGPAYPMPHPDLSAHFHLGILKALREARVKGWPDGPECAMHQALEALESWWVAGLEPTPQAMEPEAPPQVQCLGTWVFADAGELVPGRQVAGPHWLYAQGYDRFVYASRQLDGRFRYTVGKRSDLVVGFPLPRIFARLNELEAAAKGEALDIVQTWGGGSSVGGGPRLGSVLNHEAVIAGVLGVLTSTQTGPPETSGPGRIRDTPREPSTPDTPNPGIHRAEAR